MTQPPATLEEFLQSEANLTVVAGGRIVFTSTEHDLLPLVRFLKQSGSPGKAGELTVFDRYVGRASALLMTLFQPVMVHAGVLSDGGCEVLDHHGIPWKAGTRTRYLMGIASDGMCKWERLAMGRPAVDFYREVQAMYREVLSQD